MAPPMRSTNRRWSQDSRTDSGTSASRSSSVLVELRIFGRPPARSYSGWPRALGTRRIAITMRPMRVSAGLALAAFVFAGCSSTTATVQHTTAGPPAPVDITACTAVNEMVSMATSGRTISASQLSNTYSAGEQALDRGVVRDSLRLQHAFTSSDGPGVKQAINDLSSDCARLGLIG